MHDKPNNGPRERYLIGDLVLDVGACRVERDGEEISLPKLSFEFLTALVRRAPDMVTVDELMADVWDGVVVGDETVTQRAKLLRDALAVGASKTRYVETVRGKGYRLATALQHLGVESNQKPQSGSKPKLILATLLLIAAGVAIYALYPRLELQTESGPAPARSIAVLPFVSMSEDKSNEHFSDGISEELLNRLARIRGIRVAARTSAFYFKGKDEDIRTIAEKLNVETVLEGSVRKTENRIRVTAQLISAEDGYHIWAASYDRELTDIFAIQDDIASRVVDKLKATVLNRDAQHLASGGTSNLEAYTAYLLGKQRATSRTTVALNEALAYFQKAIDLDGTYALAYVGLANTYMMLRMYGNLAIDEMIANAEPALEKALSLNDELAEVQTSFGGLMELRGNASEAEKAYRRALELNPNYARAYHFYGNLLLSQPRRLKESRQLLQRALELDPLSGPINVNVALTLDAVGEFDEALERLYKIAKIHPDYPLIHAFIGQMHALAFGRLDQGARWIRSAIALDPDNPHLPSMLSIGYIMAGDDIAAERWAEQALKLAPEHVSANLAAAQLYYYRDQRPEARMHARKVLAYGRRDYAPYLILRNLDIGEGLQANALERYELAFPELLKRRPAQIDRLNYRHAIDIAYLLEHAGRDEQAQSLLRQTLGFIGKLPRMGMKGYKLSDVKIYALQGLHQEALQALRHAIDEGWRGGQYTVWMLDHDPNLTALHNHPEFKTMIAEVRAELVQVLQRLERQPELAGGSPERGI